MNTLEEAWNIIKETDLLIKELSKQAVLSRQEMDRQAQESDRRAQEADRRAQEADRRAQEADREFQETRALMRELFQKTDLKFRETDLKFQENARQFQETRQLINSVNGKLGKLGNRLGEFVEGLIKPSVVRLFQERGIAVHKVLRDIEASNPSLGLATQIDLLAINLDTCILIEVKSRLSPEDINDHLERLNKFKPLFPEYADKRVLGAVAGMVIADEVTKHAYRKGFFVIGQRGEDAVILNDDQFKPAVW